MSTVFAEDAPASRVLPRRRLATTLHKSTQGQRLLLRSVRSVFFLPFRFIRCLSNHIKSVYVQGLCKLLHLSCPNLIPATNHSL